MAYTKSVDTVIGMVHHHRFYYGDGSMTDQRSPYSLPFNRWRTGVSNPKWRQAVKLGQSATTNMTGGEQSVKLRAGLAQKITEKGWFKPRAPGGLFTLIEEYDGQMISPIKPQLFLMDSSKADAQALSRLYSALRQQRSQMQAIVTAGEFRESVKGIGAVANSLARMSAKHMQSQQRMLVKYIGRFRVGLNGSPVRDTTILDRLKKPVRGKSTWQRVHEELVDGWLSFSLGIRPLVKDAKDLAETVARWKFDHPHTRIRGYGEDSNATVYTTKGFFGTFPYLLTERSGQYVKVIYKASLHSDVDSAAKGSAHRLYQLLGSYDLENWVPSLWNLLPWSFVVDYVTNVADVVTAMVTDTSRVAWLNKTLVYGATRESSAPIIYTDTVTPLLDGGIWQNTRTTVAGDLGGFSSSTTQISRSPQSGFVLPTLSFNLPSTNGLAIPNMLALFSGRDTRTRNSHFS